MCVVLHSCRKQPLVRTSDDATAWDKRRVKPPKPTRPVTVLPKQRHSSWDKQFNFLRLGRWGRAGPRGRRERQRRRRGAIHFPFFEAPFFCLSAPAATQGANANGTARNKTTEHKQGQGKAYDQTNLCFFPVRVRCAVVHKFDRAQQLRRYTWHHQLAFMHL